MGSERILETVRDLDDPRVADYRDLRDRDLLRPRGLFMAEGHRVVRVLLGSRYRARSVLVSARGLRALEDVLPAPGAPPVLVADRGLLGRIAGFDVHRGCLAVGERGPDRPVDEILPAGPGPALAVGVEGVANTDNLGGILRNAWALGATGAMLDRTSCDPLYRRSLRVSTGASLRLPWTRLEGERGFELARDRGYTVVALVTRGAEDRIDRLLLPLERRVLVLAGEEGAGLSPATVEAADRRVSIPMREGVDSLNVATATGIALQAIGAGLGILPST